MCLSADAASTCAVAKAFDVGGVVKAEGYFLEAGDEVGLWIFYSRYLRFSVVSEASLEVDVVGDFGGVAGDHAETGFLCGVPLNKN